MKKVLKPAFTLVGIHLDRKTSNRGEQSSLDCGQLWQRFQSENIADRISGKIGDEIYAVYYDYEGDHNAPFSYFLGCKVNPAHADQDDLKSLRIPEQTYVHIMAEGKMPDCVANAWRSIWTSNKDRSYNYDFEVYDERSDDWAHAEVDIYLGTKD